MVEADEGNNNDDKKSFEELSFEKKRTQRIKEFEEKMKPREKVRIIEDDYLAGEQIVISYEIYAMTIAANMSRSKCSAVEINYALKVCTAFFISHLYVGYYWSWDHHDAQPYEY